MLFMTKMRALIEEENRKFAEECEKGKEIRKWVIDYSYQLEMDILQEEVRERWLFER
jgi:hypothetical protein